MLRRIVTFALLLCAGAAALSASDYATLAVKAQRFFDQREWSSASAMYSLMLDERPREARIYGLAMVAAGERGSTEEQMALLRQALDSQVAIDSLVSSTRAAAFEAGDAHLYERFLIAVKEGEPWLRRTVDAYLLDYYMFRDDGPGIVRLSREMLAGLPGDEGFMYKLARGQMLTGDIGGAMDTFRAILDNNPEAYDALLYLGNYYAREADKNPDAVTMATDYLGRALKIRSTPYVEQLLARLARK